MKAWPQPRQAKGSTQVSASVDMPCRTVRDGNTARRGARQVRVGAGDPLFVRSTPAAPPMGEDRHPVVGDSQMGLHRRVRRPSPWPVLALVMPAIACFAQPAPGESYAGMAEASAAVALDERHFAVAEDECNTLLVYARGQAMPVGKPIDLAAFLKTEDKASDIEGGASVGDVVYWISSHSLPKSGKPRKWRKQFFATTVSRSTSVPTLYPHGQPYTGLLDDMVKARPLRDLKLADAARRLPEQPGGLNIEGLAAGKDGGLLIGFRNPLIAGKAPVVPLKNPAEV
ncbi:MAG: DUF3616 domain-containing protein, partial [Variovorax sp.]